MKEDIMDELVTLITTEPSEEIDERSRYKYPNIASELLMCDVPCLNERVASDPALLAKLYSFLDHEPPLNPLLASFFSKVMGVLIAKKTEQVGTILFYSNYAVVLTIWWGKIPECKMYFDNWLILPLLCGSSFSIWLVKQLLCFNHLRK